LVVLAQNQQGSSHIDAKGKERKRLDDGELPPELDFFKYATAGPSKRKPSGPGEGRAVTKRHRKDESADASDANAEDEVDGESSMTTNPSDNSGMPRQRVTIKGNNAPRRADTFKELHDRYRIHSQLMDNLKRYEYEYPTGIQSAGCPILLEVGSLIV
jgi:ATP-dependent RNA helicase DDX52/ROK1